MTTGVASEMNADAADGNYEVERKETEAAILTHETVKGQNEGGPGDDDELIRPG